MNPSATDIAFLPDFTHPQELLAWAQTFVGAYLVWAVLLGAAGIVIALLLRGADPATRQEGWLTRLGAMTGQFRLVGLAMVVVMIGGLACTTLANRYRNWETDAIAKAAETVAGETMEQAPPTVSFEETEAYTEDVAVGGRPVTVNKTRTVTRYLPLAATSIKADVFKQMIGETPPRPGYAVTFAADFTVVNTLTKATNLVFEVPAPTAYAVLQNFQVSLGGKALQPIRPDTYRFVAPFQPDEKKQFHVSYKAQGAPRWVYNASNTIVSAFKLVVKTDFPDAQYASGIVPTDLRHEGGGKVFTWDYAQNVSVANPFGLFTTAPPPVSPTGRLPQLLMLAPVVFAVWLSLMALTIGVSERQVVLAAAVFFAAMVAQTYASRLIGSHVAWMLVGAMFIAAASRLPAGRDDRKAAALMAFTAVWLPVCGLLITYSGLTISLAALGCAAWLVTSQPRAHQVQ